MVVLREVVWETAAIYAFHQKRDVLAHAPRVKRSAKMKQRVTMVDYHFSITYQPLNFRTKTSEKCF